MIGQAFRRPARFLRGFLPGWNFITIHYFYFLLTTIISAIIIWGASTPPRSLRFVDAYFLSVSAMTLAGLNTVNLSTLNTFQQFMLFLLIMLGSAIFVSAFVVQVRKAAFERKLKLVARQKSRRRSWSLKKSSTIELGSSPDRPSEDRTIANLASAREPSSRNGANGDNAQAVPLDEFAASRPPTSPEMSSAITFADDVVFPSRRTARTSSAHSHHRPSRFSMQGVGARSETSLQIMSPTTNSLPTPDTAVPPHRGRSDLKQYVGSVGGWISRNSEFHGLSDEERERLGGHEYRAVSLLAWLVPAYFVLWQLLGALGCAAWVAVNRQETTRANGLNAWWVGAFNAISAFNNSGMSLLDANMTAFQNAYYLLITMGLLLLAGNTCYPIFLRLIVWTMWKIAERFRGDAWEGRARTLRFLLDHPRRCYTNLFPAQHTWWLLVAVVILNGTDWAFFEILNIGNSALDFLPVNLRVIDGLFQALAVRSGGFYVVNISTLRIALQVLYVVMMYISVYPVVITMRNSNVYEERSLGIYAEDQLNQDRESSADLNNASDSTGFLQRARTFRSHIAPSQESNSHFVRQQLRAQLAHDAWIIAFALFLIMIVESSQFSENPAVFSVFNFLFEIVSGYGCVGISVGVPWADYSFCGSWHTLSKLILCVVMIRGRHRGLPIAIDRAVLLPGESVEQAEEDDGRIRLARSMSRGRRPPEREPGEA